MVLNTHSYWKPWWPLKEAEIEYREDFVEWLNIMIDNYPMWATRLFELYIGPQYGEFCQYIGRTESLVNDFIDVMTLLEYKDKLGEDCCIPKQLSPRNGVRTVHAANQEWSDYATELMEYNEKLFIKRFYSEKTKNQRFYSNLVLEENTVSRCPEIIRNLNKQIQTESGDKKCQKIQQGL